MAKLERLKADEITFKAFANLQAKTKKALEKAFNSVKGIDSECTEEMDAEGMDDT